MSNVPDRANDPRRRPFRPTWSNKYGMHGGSENAHERATQLLNSVYNGAEKDRYHHLVLHKDPLSAEGEHHWRTYDSFIPSEENGKKGVVLRRGPFSDFHPNEDVSDHAVLDTKHDKNPFE